MQRALHLLCATVGLLVGACDRGGSASSHVEIVEGPSWLVRRHIELDRTSLGKLGGHADPPAEAATEPDPTRGRVTFRLSGADLYRLSCQSCHGPTGAGSPPEVASLIGAIEATSADAMRRRAEAAGRTIAPEMAEQLAGDAQAALSRRLEEGGEKMPAFAYLTSAERAALIEHLRRLAGVQPVATAAPELVTPATRVGELLVRGTCHICHDATGPGSHHAAMMRGEIPSLASLPRNWSLAAVIDKVRTGRSSGMGGMMGRGMMMGRSRMPVYPYLTPQEIAAAYLALAE